MHGAAFCLQLGYVKFPAVRHCLTYMPTVLTADRGISEVNNRGNNIVFNSNILDYAIKDY